MISKQNWEDLTYILDLNDEQNDDGYIAGIVDRGYEIYKERMCFFKSFEGPGDVFREMLAIIRYPLAFSIGAVITTFNTIASAFYLAGSLVLALGATLIMQNEYRDAALDAAGEALLFTGANLLGTVACLLLAVLSIPNNTASLLSRTAATIIPPLEDCCYIENNLI